MNQIKYKLITQRNVHLGINTITITGNSDLNNALTSLLDFHNHLIPNDQSN